MCVTKLNGTKWKDGYILVSLDVVNLFTSIPLSLIKTAVEE
jgi:hypothetical protein